MRVQIGSDNQVIGEMTGDVVGHIAEQITDATRLDQFQPGWSAKGAALATAAEDENPHFVVVRVEEGWSRSRRLWTGSMLDSIAEQTNALEPVGHLGHIKDEDAPTAFPDPQTTWFGAFTKVEPSQQKERLGEQVKVVYLGGYNYPDAKVRKYIKTKAVRGISWWGNGDVQAIPGKGVEVKNFTLKALDWARKLAEGMPTSSVVATVSEMEDSMDKPLSAVTPEEIRKENPNLVTLLVRDAVAEKDTQIGEMEQKVQEGEKAKSLLAKACELLGIDKPEELENKITELSSKIGEKAKATLQAGLDAVLLEKLPGDENKDKRELVKRLLPVGEMEAGLSDKSDDEATKFIGEQVDEAIDKDSTIKTVIGEMQPPVVRRREELRSGGGTSNGVQKTRVKL